MWLIILLILLGVLFLVAELVLLPGVSLGALFALVCYGSAIYTAFADYGPFTGGIVVLIILALSFVATVLSLRSKTWQRFSLKQKIESSSMPLPDNEVKAGDRGVAVSRLAPMGKVEIGGRIYEAKSTDVYIDQAQHGRGGRVREFQRRRAQGRRANPPHEFTNLKIVQDGSNGIIAIAVFAGLVALWLIFISFRWDCGSRRWFLASESACCS